MIEYVTALAWPVACVLIVFGIRSIVKIVLSSKGEMDFHLKDWIKIGAKAAPQREKYGLDTQIEPAEVAGSVQAPALTRIQEPSENRTGPNQSEKNASDVSAFLVSKNLEELPMLFELFKNSEGYRTDPDFWESYYIDRRKELGRGNYSQELNSLLSTHNDWVWPLIFLIRYQIEVQDLEVGERELQRALSRSSPSNRKWVVAEGIRLYFTLVDSKRAMEFARKQLSNDLDDGDKASMFSTLASEFNRTGDSDSFILFKEIELTLRPDANSERFSLAFAYGELERFPVLSYWHYRRIMQSAPDWAGPPNNLGVISGAVSQEIQNDFYSKAIVLQNALAAANLAHRLVHAGFISTASDLLQQFSDDDNEEYAANIAEAKSVVLKARRKLEKEQVSLESFVDAQFGRFRGAIMDAYRYFLREGANLDAGVFLSGDKTIQIYVSDEGAACRIPFGNIILEGVLPCKANCFLGELLAGNSLLTSVSVNFLIVPVTGDLLRLIQLPKSLSREQTISSTELTRVPIVQQLENGANSGELPKLESPPPIAE